MAGRENGARAADTGVAYFLHEKYATPQACRALLAFMHRHPISATWGRSDLAASDMMSKETSQRVFVARNDPHRLTHSVGIHSHARSLGHVFLCDYFVNDAFRREPLRVLNRSEAVDALKRAIYFGRVSSYQAKQHEEMQAADALSLLANPVMAWNTMKMQSVLDRWNTRRSSAVPPCLIGRIAPTRTEGINLRGVITFPIE